MTPHRSPASALDRLPSLIRTALAVMVTIAALAPGALAADWSNQGGNASAMG